jgi:coniferyl-aldehyde dehydrogenase
MNDTAVASETEVSRESMLATLQVQRDAYLADGFPSAALRRDRLSRCVALLVDHGDALCEAMCADFGHRSMQQSLFTDIASSIGALKHAGRHVEKWMRPEKRKAQFPFGLFGGRARIEYQPLGVVGCISPWNFPVNLTFAPLAGILAAGNRCLIKPSEYTPATSALMAELVASHFDASELTVICGGPETGAAFASLPFDHLLFTGATNVARHVMRAAAENLVPVTLELGGKSPVIIGRSADMALTAKRVMTGKMLNAGQICLAPDYVLVPEERQGEFVEAAKASVKALYPTLLDNPDYTSVINQRHYDRLNDYVEDARAQGAEVVEINPAGEDFRQQPHHRIPPTLVLDPTDDMKVMQEEIFGPILPVRKYRTIDETIGYVNGRDRPLGLYYFGTDRTEQDRVLTSTTSGGVTVNDVIMHIAHEDLPFGGVGPSGMGVYHGYDGFKTFSHGKSVYSQPKFDLAAFAGILPPYGEKFEKTVRGQISK